MELQVWANNYLEPAQNNYPFVNQNKRGNQSNRQNTQKMQYK